jgi:hypothetical protein
MSGVPEFVIVGALSAVLAIGAGIALAAKGDGVTIESVSHVRAAVYGAGCMLELIAGLLAAVAGLAWLGYHLDVGIR